MKPETMNRRTLLAAGAGVVATVGALRAQSPAVEAGFVPLFDGQTLVGWSVQDGPPSAFRVTDGAIVVDQKSNFPTWLRSDKQYENFDFRCEFFLQGWTNSGVYLHAPEHGRNTWVGMKINIFHQADAQPKPESAGSIFPLIAPKAVNVKGKDWNSLRALMDWPRLQVWMNDTLVQDLDVEQEPELRHRLRRGYIGFESLSYPIRFRNIRIRELPAKEIWQALYEGPEDFAKWQPSSGKALFEPRGAILRGDGDGQLATKETFRDFVLHLYIRGVAHHNGGIMFRSIPGGGRGGRGQSYEIQLHDVEGAHYATGSLYSFKRASYPRIEPEKWALYQLVVQNRHCLVRINGDTVLEYEGLENLEAGRIELQAHDAGKWLEYKQIKIRRL